MEKEHIKTLIVSNPKKISSLYNEHRASFFGFGKKYGLDYDDLSDIYQEAFIALRKHALKGKLNAVKSSLKTYLFGIGKFMIYDTLKVQKKTSEYEPAVHLAHDAIEAISFEVEHEELTIEQSLLRTNFIKLGKKCQEVLTLFYSRGLSIDEIVGFTDYTNGSVVRSQKSRCIKTLRGMIKS
jgi:RNA polymerase sigma factor (sigma-70 family)